MNATGGTVLVVDDHRAVLRLLETMLSLRGYRVLHAADGVAGVEAARRERPDLILLDVMMPGLDGFQACRMLKDDPLTADIPVVFLTAREDEADPLRSRQAGAAEFLRKPFKSQQILAVLNRYLGPPPSPAGS